MEHRVRLTALLFNHVGDGSATFNLPNRPMLDPISGLLLTLGLSYCLIWGRYRWQGYFALTFLALLLMGTVFVHNFDPRRLQGVIPLIFVLAAFVVDRFWQVAVGSLGPRVRPVLVLTAIAVLAVAFRDNYNVYFRGMMEDPRRAFRLSEPRHHRPALPASAPAQRVHADVLRHAELLHAERLRVAARRHGSRRSDRRPVAGLEWRARPFGLDASCTCSLRIRSSMTMSHACCTSAFPTPVARLTDPDIPAHLHFSACAVPPAGSPRAAAGRGACPLLPWRRHRAPSERFEPAIGYALFPDVCSFPLAREKLPCHAEWEGTWEVP